MAGRPHLKLGNMTSRGGITRRRSARSSRPVGSSLADRYDARVIAAVRAAGYLGATTTRHGLARSGGPYELARIHVDGGDGAAGLARSLAELGG